MAETKTVKTNTEQTLVGNEGGYHGYVTKRDGKLYSVSLYQGQKQMATALQLKDFRVLQDILNTVVEVAEE